MTLEIHELELCGFTYTQIFFSKYLYCFPYVAESPWMQRAGYMH